MDELNLDNKNLPQSGEIPRELKPPLPENNLSPEELNAFVEAAKKEIVKQTGNFNAGNQEKLAAMAGRLAPDAVPEGLKILEPGQEKANIYSEEAQKAISAELKKQGLTLPDQPAEYLNVPDIDYNRLPDKKAKPVETIKVQPEKTEFDEAKLRDGLKSTGGLTDEIIEMIVSQEKAKAQGIQEKEVKAEPVAEVPKTRAEEVKAHYDQVKADVAERMAQAKLKMAEQAEAKRAAAEAKKQEEIQTPAAEAKPEVKPSEEIPVKKDKIDRVDDKELKVAQTLLAEGMDMKKNLEAWNDLIDSQMAQLATQPEKQSRINKFLDKVRGLIDRTENLIGKIFQRNKLDKISKLLTPEGRKDLMNAVTEKIQTKLGEAMETEPAKKKAPKFDEKKLRSYLKDQGVPPEITEEIIAEEKSEVKKLEKKGRLPAYAKEVKRRLSQLENDIKYKAKSANDQMKDMKNDFVNFKNEMAGAMNKAGSEWKKMHVMESIASKFKGYLNRGQVLLVTEAERLAIKNQQRKLENERIQMRRRVEQQALERQRQEAAAQEAARKKEEMAQRAKAKQEKARTDEIKKADRDLAKAQKELALAQAKVQKAEANKARIAAAELARKTKSEEIEAKEAAKRQRVAEVKSHNQEVAQDFKARTEAAREKTQAEGESKRQETAQVNQPLPEAMPAPAATGEQLYGREAEGYEQLAKQQATEQTKEEPPVRINVNQPPAQSPDQFKKAA